MPWTKVIVTINGLDRDFNWDENLSFLGSFSPWGATTGKLLEAAEPQGWGLVWDEDNRLLLVRITKSRWKQGLGGKLRSLI